MVYGISREYLYDLYVNKRMSTRQIAQIIGAKSHSSVRLLMKKHNIEPRGKIIDLVGKIIGNVTVLEQHGTKNYSSQWKCKCLCGKIFISGASKLSQNKTCGCHIVDLTGLCFNDIKVLGLSFKRNRSFYWNCECKCGKKIVVRSDALKNIKTCGCGKKEDLSNKKFNKLTVIGIGPTRNKRVYWKCKCECGKVIDVATSNIKRTYSCGCTKASKMEMKILRCLENNLGQDYKIIKDYYNNILYNKDTNGTQKVDFMIFHNNKYKFAIEYDGKHHFQPVMFGGISYEVAKDNLIKQVKNDRRKNNILKKMGVPLVRFNCYEKLTNKMIMDKINGIVQS